MALLTATLPAAAVAAQTPHRASMDVAVGGDSNPALAANPRDRARMDSSVLAPAATFALDVWSRLRVFENEALRLLMSPYFSARGFSSGGAYMDLGFNGALRHQLGPLALDLGANLGGYAATFALDNALYGDVSLAALVNAGPLTLGVEGYARFRSYTENQLDGVYGARVVARAEHGPRVRWEAQLGADQRRSNNDLATRAELYSGLEIGGTEGRWQWVAGALVFARWFASAPRDGREWLARARVDRELRGRLGLFLEVQAGRARSVRGGEDALVYNRGAVEVGITLRLHPEPQPLENESAERVSSGRYRFLLHAPGAREVVLLADFLDWDASRGALTSVGDGWFEGEFDVPEGRHRYRMLVDGQPVTPPARAYAEDGFGGRDAVLTVD